MKPFFLEKFLEVKTQGKIILARLIPHNITQPVI